MSSTGDHLQVQFDVLAPEDTRTCPDPSYLGQRNQRQIGFSISCARQEPRGSVGSSAISDPAVPGSNSTAANSNFISVSFFSQSEDSEKFQILSHVRRWPPHIRSEVCKNLPADFYRV